MGMKNKKVFRIGVIDDTAEDYARIRQIINKCFENAAIEHFSDCTQLVNHNSYFHLIFLDVHLEKQNGIEMQKIVRQYTSYIVFFTAYPTQIRYAFGYKVIGFLSKLDSDDQLTLKLQQLKNEYFDELVHYLTSAGEININRNSITRISVENRRIYVHLSNGKSLLLRSATLSECVEQLGEVMQKINPSEYVNLDHIKSIDGQKIDLINGDTVYASRRMRKLVQQKYVRRLI